MEITEPVRSEETASDYAPATEFNIAGAFPVTDKLVRQVARRQRKEQFDRALSSLRVRCIAAGLIGFVVGAGVARSR